MSLKSSEVTYFLSGIVLLFLLYGNYLLCILGVVYLLYAKEYKSILVISACFILIILQRYNVEYSNVVEGKVILKNSSYCIVDVGLYNVLVYDSNVYYDDRIQVEGVVKEIVSVNNRVGFSFKEWCKSKSIEYAMYPNRITVLKNGKSLRHLVSKRLEVANDKVRDLVSLFLFHNSDLDIDWLNLCLSFGMHISFVVYFVKGLFSYFFVEDRVSKIELFLYLLFGLFYQFDFITVRLILKYMLKFSSLSKHNQWGVLVLILVILYPNMIFSNAFVFPILISFILVFSNHKVVGSIDVLYIWLQLYFNGYVSLGNLMITKIFRYVFGFVYGLCFLSIWIDLSTIMCNIYDILCSLDVFELNQLVLIGKPNIFMNLFFIFLITYYVSTNKKFVCILILLLCNCLQSYYFPFARVVYIDVGQGDCTLIMLPFNRGNVLIDTGGSLYSDVAKDIVFPVLSSYGISSLDVVVLSHDDLDHSGAFSSLNSLIAIQEVVTSKNSKYVVDSLEMYDLLFDDSFDDSNANSITCCFSLYGSSFLFLGDIGIEQEEILVREYDDLHIDYLKVAHHGSNTSTSSALLEQVRCDYAIISCGRNNRYNHPSYEVIERLNGYKIDYLITSEVGMIEIIVTPFFDWIQFENDVILKYKCH